MLRTIFLLISGLSLVAQTGIPSDVLKKNALQAMQNKDWKSAAALYESITDAEPANAGAWAQLGNACLRMEQFSKAANAFEKSVAIQPSPFVMYNLACAYALGGNSEKAWFWLRKTVSSGYFSGDQLRADSDLNSLRSKGFDDLIKRADSLSHPCQFDPMARQFDFWAGEWDVFSIAGQKVGNSSIQQLTDGCIIMENWEGYRGGTGKSMNFYDAQRKAWRQIWMSNSGAGSEFSGAYHDSVMDFRGERLLPDGTTAKTRLRFFYKSPEEVRQFSEQSADSGKSWQTNYDFLYVRKKQKP